MIIVGVRSQEDLEEGSRWQETVEALRSIDAGQGIPEGEVHAWLASWGRPDERKPPER